MLPIIMELDRCYERAMMAKRMLDDKVPVEKVCKYLNVTKEQLVNAGIIQEEQEYIIPVSYKVEGYVKVKALSHKDAIATVNKYFDDMPLLEHARFVPNTYCASLDEEEIKTYTELYNATGELGVEPTDSELKSDALVRLVQQTKE